MSELLLRCIVRAKRGSSRYLLYIGLTVAALVAMGVLGSIDGIDLATVGPLLMVCAVGFGFMAYRGAISSRRELVVELEGSEEMGLTGAEQGVVAILDGAGRRLLSVVSPFIYTARYAHRTVGSARQLVLYLCFLNPEGEYLLVLEQALAAQAEPPSGWRPLDSSEEGKLANVYLCSQVEDIHALLEELHAEDDGDGGMDR